MIVRETADHRSGLAQPMVFSLMHGYAERSLAIAKGL